MPCGGVRRVPLVLNCECWVCQIGGCAHFVDEWDAYIHARCVIPFLASPEGQIVISHGHDVLIDFGVAEGP